MILKRNSAVDFEVDIWREILIEAKKKFSNFENFLKLIQYFQNIAEDKAVDLYVLERAIASTHMHSQSLLDEFYKAYDEVKNLTQWDLLKLRRKLRSTRSSRKRSWRNSRESDFAVENAIWSDEFSPFKK